MFRVAEYHTIGVKGIRFSSGLSLFSSYWFCRNHPNPPSTSTKTTKLKMKEVDWTSSERRARRADSIPPRSASPCIVHREESKRREETTRKPEPMHRRHMNRLESALDEQIQTELRHAFPGDLTYVSIHLELLCIEAEMNPLRRRV